MDRIELPPFQVDPRTRVLYRDGEIERVPPRTIEVLLALLEHRGEIVTKEELLRRVWPDTIVEEGNLSVHVSLLRRTLGAAAPIETVAKRGYRIPTAPRSGSVASPAREDLLRGRHFWNKLQRPALERAHACFARAAETGPASGEARSGQCDTRIMQGLLGFAVGRSPFEEALGHAEAAVRLSPGSADAHASRAFALLFARWDVASAEQAMGEARRLAPERVEPLLWTGLLLALRGRFLEALESLRLAHEIDPLSVNAGVGLGFHLYLSQQHQPETASLESVLELEPESAVAHWALGLAQERLGRLQEAELSYRRAVGLSGGSLTMESNLARCLALSGRPSEAEASLVRLESGGLSPYRVATVELALGRPDRAISALERGLVERDPWMIWIGVDPMLDPLRATPAFAPLVRSVLG
jgi:DNA-binding winged helix-turn-helix (wHTH) protein/Flp pilus assembly protein TadD